MSINEPLVLSNGVELKNRLVKASTTEGLADPYGNVTPELIQLYKTYAEESELGAIFSGNIQVDRRYLERPGNVVLDLDYGEVTDEQRKLFEELAAAGKSGGSKFLLQVGHAGRQATGLVCKTSVGPSNVASTAKSVGVVPCVEASKEYLMRVKEKFVYAAKVLEETGFDGLELHAAHGYLFSSFLSPLANIRTDEFGGSLENRARLLLDTVREIKAQRKKNEFIIAVKLNSADFQKGGLTLEEGATVSEWLADAGCDILELSGGNYESSVVRKVEEQDTNAEQKSTLRREAFYLEFAAEISKNFRTKGLTQTTIMVTGGFRARSVMDEAISGQDCSLVGIGRPLCVDPSCTKKLLQNKISELPRSEKFWRLPYFLGWDMMQGFQTIYQIKFGAQMMQYFQNMIDMGAGKKLQQDNQNYPNIFSTLLSIRSRETKSAHSLKGYHEDECLQPYISRL